MSGGGRFWRYREVHGRRWAQFRFDIANSLGLHSSSTLGPCCLGAGERAATVRVLGTGLSVDPGLLATALARRRPRAVLEVDGCLNSDVSRAPTLAEVAAVMAGTDVLIAACGAALLQAILLPAGAAVVAVSPGGGDGCRCYEDAALVGAWAHISIFRTACTLPGSGSESGASSGDGGEFCWEPWGLSGPEAFALAAAARQEEYDAAESTVAVGRPPRWQAYYRRTAAAACAVEGAALAALAAATTAALDSMDAAFCPRRLSRTGAEAQPAEDRLSRQPSPHSGGRVLMLPDESGDRSDGTSGGTSGSIGYRANGGGGGREDDSLCGFDGSADGSFGGVLGEGAKSRRDGEANRRLEEETAALHASGGFWGEEEAGEYSREMLRQPSPPQVVAAAQRAFPPTPDDDATACCARRIMASRHVVPSRHADAIHSAYFCRGSGPGQCLLENVCLRLEDPGGAEPARLVVDYLTAPGRAGFEGWTLLAGARETDSSQVEVHELPSGSAAAAGMAAQLAGVDEEVTAVVMESAVPENAGRRGRRGVGVCGEGAAWAYAGQTRRGRMRGRRGVGVCGAGAAWAGRGAVSRDCGPACKWVLCGWLQLLGVALSIAAPDALLCC